MTNKIFSEKLRNNPLLVSLLLLNQSAGLKHLGFEVSETEKKIGVSEVDAKRAEDLLGNNFQINEPQIVQIAQNEDILIAPKISAESFDRDSDIEINISTEILKYSLKRFAKSSFIGQKFKNFLIEDWWEIEAVGENIELQSSEDGIIISATFECEIEIDSEEFEADKIKFPMTIEIIPAFVISENQLYLSISKAQISLLDFYFPNRSSEKISNLIAKIIPYIPVCEIPTKFVALGKEPAPTVFLTDAKIDEHNISLSFQIDENFEVNKNVSKPVRQKKVKGITGLLSDSWIGQPNLWSYEHYTLSEETIGKSCGQAAMATVSDFFERNPFTLKPKDEPTADGRYHYHNHELVGNFYDWYYPRFETLGETAISGREDITKAISNMKLGFQEYHPEVFGDGIEAQKLLIEWIVKTQLPVIVLLDIGKLTVLENLSTGINEAQPKNMVAHWGIVYAVNNLGVKLGSWGNEYFIPWEIFMKAWNCDFLPYPNNFYQIQVWENK